MVRPLSGQTSLTIGIMQGKVPNRQVVMELLYCVGGLKGREIGEILGVEHTSVSRERRRLREQLSKDRRLEALIKCIEQKCHG